MVLFFISRRARDRDAGPSQDVCYAQSTCITKVYINMLSPLYERLLTALPDSIVQNYLEHQEKMRVS
jgi:hypothetical protein